MTAGQVAPGFEAVAATFAEVVPDDGPGAAFAATVDGRSVVDLWGGTRDDDGARWQDDTVCVLFSGTKGVVATAMLVLVERGALALEQPVAELWPEFAAAGKEAVTVGDVLGHAAGLPGIAAPLTPEDGLDGPRAFPLLAAQAPLTPIGQATYHARTYGLLCDALARRADGRSIARVVADELAAPLGLDLWIGVPDAVLPRVAWLRRAEDFDLAAYLASDPDPRLELVYHNPPLFGMDWNAPEVLQAEIAAANGVATARSVARLYGCLACGGSVDGVRLLRPETIVAGRRERSAGDDPLSGRPLRFAAGYELWGTPSELGPADDAFGHTGSGGSSHGAWPGLRTGFSFVMRELRPETADDRARRLLGALHAAVTTR